MKVQFRNSYSSKVWIAVMYYSPDTCKDFGLWKTEGWWGVSPGQQIWAFSTDNRYAAFYAEAEDGAVWSGIYGPMSIYDYAFRICIDLGQIVQENRPSTSLVDSLGSVGCMLIDTNGRDTIVNLIA